MLALLRGDAASWYALSGISTTTGLFVASIFDNDALAFLIGLAGLVIGGFHLLLTDVLRTKTELLNEIREVKACVRRLKSDLRSEVLQDGAQLRNEFLRQTAELRSELLRETAGLGNQLLRQTEEFRAEFKLISSSASTADGIRAGEENLENVIVHTDAFDGADLAIDDARPPEALSLLGRRMWEYFSRRSADRKDYLQAVEEGVIVLTERRHIRRALEEFAEGACEEILAVDHIAIENWFRIDLKDYLDLQLERAREGIHLQRVRLFDPSELENADQRDLLRVFLEMHQEAGAELILCPLNADVRRKFHDLIFFPRVGSYPRTGCLLLDKDRSLSSFRGIVGENGFITTAEVDLIPNHPARRCVGDYEELLKRIGEGELHEAALQSLLAKRSASESGDGGRHVGLRPLYSDR